MYLDKLDGKISEGFWARHHAKLQNDKDEASIKLIALEKTDKNYFGNAELILELSKKAYTLFTRQNAFEKRKLINLITAECVYKENTLHIKLKAPFDKVLLILKNWKHAPPARLELATNWLTANCSTDWATGEYNKKGN